MIAVRALHEGSVARRRVPVISRGLSQEEAAVLGALASFGEATLADVQERTGLQKKNAVRALDA